MTETNLSGSALLKTKIEQALGTPQNANLREAAGALFNTLGYTSIRTAEPDDSPQAFIDDFPPLTGRAGTQTEQYFLAAAESVHIIFQLTSEEIRASGQLNLLGEPGFDKGYTRSFLFMAVQLKPDNYVRGNYADMTREINKRLAMPTVVLFVNGGHATLAFVRRRAHKKQQERAVLDKVSLIRDVVCAKPHRAHLDILAELSLPARLQWMSAHGKTPNFDGLLAAWLDVLDTEELNRRFYRDLFGWFKRAVKTAKFPCPENRPVSMNDHVIRLITRVLFIWFIKEKKLVAEDLFIEHSVKSLLKDQCANDGSDYYRAVLQNLFFATLNTEISQRGFSRANNSTHRNFNRYRYKDLLTDPQRLLALMKHTPFINGGLFDCLDSEEATTFGGYRLDCFSDNLKHRKGLSVPNHLFFNEQDGLFPLLNKYKFTVEENTPVEQEVALDPELLGKVFENLLAAHNPETRDTARKQTGSYYTPRAVVDYMTDEALVATLAQKAQPNDSDNEYWQERLRYLLDYEDAFNDAQELFEKEEVQNIVTAISNIKALDPAAGSGAFPMGILHKLALALRRIDPDNNLWENLQKDRARQRADAAFDTAGHAARSKELLDISETFERYRDSDFGRKLYLIQNSIYGVDIQPVACQIAKLRFFISLAIEQETDPTANNYGIKPLPNLETRFVAANTLIGLQSQKILSSARTIELETAIHANRERHFHAATRDRKRRYRKEDKRLRKELADELKQVGMPGADADKIAAWDPYDQNAKADWFDAEYMFGVAEGFDVVIGNPPYIQLQKNGGRLGRLYQDAGYTTFARAGDIYQLFYEKGINLLKPDTGHVCFISSNQWMRVDSGKALRKFIESQNPLRLINLGASVFDSVTVNTCILLINRAPNKNALQATQQFPPTEWVHTCPADDRTWTVLPDSQRRIKAKMDAAGIPLNEWNLSINYGIKTGYDKAFLIDDAAQQRLIAEDPKSAEIIKPALRGRDIQRYRAQWAGLWLIDTHNGYDNVPAVNVDDYPVIKNHLDSYYPQLVKRQDKGKSPYNLRSCVYHGEFIEEKIVWGNLNNQARFSYAPKAMFVNAPTTILTPYSHYLVAALNSKLLDWYFRLIGVERDGGYWEYKPMFIKRLPVPQITIEEQQPLIRLVERILAEKATDTTADTSAPEAEIDHLVYQLYELTSEQIEIIEESCQ